MFTTHCFHPAAQNTLWPEAHKLYGHGDMIYCCAASPDGAYLASACVAKVAAAASIWIWDIRGGTWKGIAQLQSHTLTVTQLSWSHCGRYLAACSRDRSFTVFERVSQPAVDASQPSQQLPDSFRLVAKVKAAHARVLWGISWSHDDTLLATGARDNVVKIWRTGLAPDQAGHSSLDPQLSQLSQPALVLPPFASPVTAVSFAETAAPVSGDQTSSVSSSSSYLLAVGLESGQVQLWEVSMDQQQAGVPAQAPAVTASRVWQTDACNSHAAQVNAISWKGQGQEGAAGSGEDTLRFVSCADDHSIRVFAVGV